MATLELDSEVTPARRAVRVTPRLRRLLLVLVVTALCAVTYFVGIWVGSSGRMTCVTNERGRLVCTTGDQPPAAESPRQLPQQSGSA
jgi:hypothetical protein